MRRAGDRVLNRGGWGNGVVYLTEIDGTVAVAKTYAGKPAPIRLLGRWLIAREKRAYRTLAGVPGVPRLLQSDDALTLVLEYIPGEKISHRLLAGDGAEIIASLEAVIERIHGRGVYHLDLRNQGNILIDDAKQAHLVDFASAVMVSPGALGRAFGRLLARIDRAALAKWAARV